MNRTITNYFIFLTGIALVLFQLYFPAGDFKIYFLAQLIWIVLAIISSTFIRQAPSRYNFLTKDMKDSAFIAGLILLIAYYLSGLLVGYSRSPYNHTLVGIFKNIWLFLVIKATGEFVRYKFINSNKKLTTAIWVTIVFATLEVNISSYDFANLKTFIDFFAKEFTPVLIKSSFLSYLAFKDSWKSALLFRLPLDISLILTPIMPKDTYFIASLINTIIPLFAFIRIENLQEKVHKRFQKIEKFSFKPFLKQGLYITILITVSLFSLGYFKYQPIVILSNSMVPNFSKGDVVVIDKKDCKNNQSSCDDIKINDIIIYDMGDKKIVHRIIKLQNTPSGKKYTTKGDNNSTPDANYVTASQVEGIVKFSIPKIGYPSIWFRDFITKK